MRDTDERQHPHPHESLLYHTNVFSTEDLIHLCSRPTCLLIYQFLPPSLLAWNHIPQNQSHGPGCDSAECTGQVLIPSIFQILCKSNVKKAHCINIFKICLSLSLFSFLLRLSTCLSLCPALTARSFSYPCLERGSYKGLPQINKTTI